MLPPLNLTRTSGVTRRLNSGLLNKLICTGGLGYSAIAVVEYSSQRLDHNSRRARSDSHTRQLGLLRVPEQHLLPELSERPLTDPCPYHQCRLRHNLGNGSYTALLHNEERQTTRRA